MFLQNFPVCVILVMMCCPLSSADTVQKAAWYGVEAFGKVAGRGNDNGDEATPSASEGVVRLAQHAIVSRAF